MSEFALSVLSACCVAAGTAPVPVILDTDIGGDIDDTWALAMLLGEPGVDLKLIVTGFDDTPAKTRLTAKILERVGRTDVPIGTGVKTSDRKLNQAAWLGDYTLDQYPGKVHEDGVKAMIDAIHASPVPVTLMAIGPVTNVGEALRRDPSIAKNARVVTMAGGVYVGYDNKPTPEPECNVVNDIPAFRALLAAPWDIVMSPVDGCGDMRIRGDRYAAVRDSESPLARVVVENYDLWEHRKHQPADSSSILFDTVAAYLTYDEAYCDLRTVKVSVSDEGITVPDGNGRAVSCQLGWKDRAAFEDLIVRTLTRKSR